MIIVEAKITHLKKDTKKTNFLHYLSAPTILASRTCTDIANYAIPDNLQRDREIPASSTRPFSLIHINPSEFLTTQ